MLTPSPRKSALEGCSVRKAVKRKPYWVDIGVLEDIEVLAEADRLNYDRE